MDARMELRITAGCMAIVAVLMSAAWLYVVSDAVPADDTGPVAPTQIMLPVPLLIPTVPANPPPDYSCLMFENVLRLNGCPMVMV